MSSYALAQLTDEVVDAAATEAYRQILMKPDGVDIPTIDNGPPDFAVVKQQYQSIIQPLFEPYLRMPDPASYDGAINDMSAAMANLSQGKFTKDPISEQIVPANPALHLIDSASGTLQDWNGEAADAFKNYFLGRFDAVCTNQFLVLGVMKGALEADKAVWESARRDIARIAEGTITALDNMHSCGKNEVKFAISVAAAVGAVLTIPFTGGLSAAAVPAAVSAAAATAAAAQDGTEVAMGGATVDQIVQSMKTGIDKLTEEIRVQQDKIAKALDAYADLVYQEKGVEKSPFVTPRPKLAGMEGATLLSNEGLGTYN